ncbi:23S rRNA (uracil(1939)-C(5))-methyltransferase RlmD [Mycoplasma miroungirhinis]|uniref:23S rRNA (Uracil(1939)-C(5))-methyltransferase RlmD n=1 Tax=Mycoplasma miroungirhinis TaxID=754516 RepID=A0A6M4JH46_9MOLU|nr:23S rRNA (uracil(1939)-C(5))-methyltransferase RlmD [Mycoplasma miroungirhinis]QJR44342.1 23S rRNA (uracil(1939)-C(5))-methyltransferase RlmD [Mycoplasma miroungirhinis]
MEYKVNDVLKHQETTEFSYDALGVIRKKNYSIFVFGMLENEIADIKLVKVNSKFAFAKIINLIKTNPKRINGENNLKEITNNPLSILSYKDQLEFKQNIVSYLFKRQLNYENVKPIIPSINEWNYRNKIVLFLELENNKYKMGTYEKMSHNLVEETEYNLATSLIKKVILFLKHNINRFNLQNNKLKRIMIRSNKDESELQIVFITENKHKINEIFIELLISKIKEIKSIIHNVDDVKDKNNLLGFFFNAVYGNNFINDKIENFKFKINWNSFFQINSLQTSNLYNTMLNNINVNPDDIILDAYCGIGTITSFLAKKAKKVIGIEIVKDAILNAKEAQKINNISNIDFYANDIDKQMNILKSKNINFDIVCVDPPRAGLSLDFINLITSQKPREIAYISCNVHTMVRDLIYFKERGYDIKFIQPVDMFPQTPHIEVVGILFKK